MPEYMCIKNDSKNIIIFKNDQPIGYVVSIKEAEALCDKHNELQWDFCTRKEREQKLPKLTIHDDI